MSCFYGTSNLCSMQVRLIAQRSSQHVVATASSFLAVVKSECCRRHDMSFHSFHLFVTQHSCNRNVQVHYITLMYANALVFEQFYFVKCAIYYWPLNLLKRHNKMAQPVNHEINIRSHTVSTETKIFWYCTVIEATFYLCTKAKVIQIPITYCNGM